MKKKYTYLTREDRAKLSILHAQKLSICKIAKIMQRSKSTIQAQLNATSVFNSPY